MLNQNVSALERRHIQEALSKFIKKEQKDTLEEAFAVGLSSFFLNTS